MINKIAISTIVAVLVTRVAFAVDTVIQPGESTADCKSPVIDGVTGQVNNNTVNYLADWVNKTYTVNFDENTGTGAQATSSCVYYDSTDSTENKAPCDLTHKQTAGVYGITKTNNILLGWTEFENGTGTSFALSDANPLTGLSATTLGNESNTQLTLYAKWGECTYNTNNTSPANTNVSVGVDGNVCQYTVSCDTGYEITSNPCGTGTTWDLSAGICTNSVGVVNTTITACSAKIYDISLSYAAIDNNDLGHVYEKYATGWYAENDPTASGTAITTLDIPNTDSFVFRGFYTSAQSNVDVDNNQGTLAMARGIAHDSNDGLDYGTITLPANTTYTADTTLYSAWARKCDNATTLASNNVATCRLQIGINGAVTYTSTCKAGFHASGSDDVTAQPNGTAHPVCVANSINLTWDKNTGAGAAADDMTIVSGEGKNNTCEFGATADQDGHIVVPQPTRAGYIFNGWKIGSVE